MARAFEVTSKSVEVAATAQLRAIRGKLPRRVAAHDRSAVVKLAAGEAEGAKASRFVAPTNRYGVACWSVARTLQGAADIALMHHTAAPVYEIAADRTVTTYALKGA